MSADTGGPAAQRTAAEVCQQHIDEIEALGVSDAEPDVRAALGALGSAVLSLLYLTRNTDNAGRAAQAEIDAELERIRETKTLPRHAEGWVVLRQSGFGAWSVVSQSVCASERRAGLQVIDKAREVVVPWQGTQAATLDYRITHGIEPTGRLP